MLGRSKPRARVADACRDPRRSFPFKTFEGTVNTSTYVTLLYSEDANFQSYEPQRGAGLSEIMLLSE